MVLEDPGCVDSIIQDWQSVLPATLNKWKIEQKDLQIFFEDFRNNLLQNKEVTKPPKHCCSAVPPLYFAISCLDASCLTVWQDYRMNG